MSKLIAITLAILAAAVTCQADSPLPNVGMDLADLLRKSSDAMAKNPEQTTKCFNAYTPKTQALADDYNRKLGGCQDAETAANQKINQEVAGNIASITQWHQEICGSYSNCNQGGTDPQGFFSCNNDAAGGAITTSYNIQTMSKDKMEYVSAQYQMVKYNKKSCTDTCEDEYVKGSKNLYDALQQCINTTEAPTPTEKPEEPEEPEKPEE